MEPEVLGSHMVDPVPLESYYDLALPSSPNVSPDGERVAFVATEFDAGEDERRTSLFVAPADGSRDPHRLTRVADAGQPKWSPSGDRLAFTAAREEDVALTVGRDDGGEGDEERGTETDAEENGTETDDDGGDGEDEPRSQVWVFDMELGGDPRQLTEFDEGVRQFDWGPDGERIVVAARDPTDEEQEYLQQRREDDGPIETERLQHKFDGSGWLDTVTTYLFVVDLSTRETTKLEDARGRGAFEAPMGLQPAWAPGERIAFVTNRTETPDDSYEMDVHTIAPDGSDRRRLTEGEMASSLSWSPAGERIAFTAREPDNWYAPTEAYVVDSETGEYESVSADLGRTLARSGAPTWLDDETLVALAGDDGWTRPVRLHVDCEALAASGSRTESGAGESERVFGRLGRDETLTGLDADGGTVAVITSHPSEGEDVFAFPEAGLDADEAHDDPRVRLSELNAEFVAEHDLPETTRISFDSEDGQTVEAVVYHPTEFDPDDPEPRPTVLKIHGGPMSYDSPGFGVDETVYTSRGHLVVEVNYRGSTSYGRAFCEELKGAWNTKEVADLRAGVDAVVERRWADSDRLFCTGFSQGGVNTAYMVTTTDRFAAAATEHGVYDNRSAFGTDDSHNWWEADFGLPWEDPGAYDDSSSITDVGEVDTPLLVTAGGEDWRCPPTQAEQLYVSVRKQGVPARLVVYPDEHHDIGDPDRAIHRLEELTEWFERFDSEVE